MNLRELLEEKHSKEQSVHIAKIIGSSSSKFAELVDLVCGDDKILAQRGSWAITCCAEENKELVRPFLKILLQNLARPGLHDAVKRNTMKVAAESEIPDDFAGLAVDTAFRILEDEDESIAARAHSMTLLERFAVKEPALADELRAAILQQIHFESSPGFQSRARRVLKAIEQLN